MKMYKTLSALTPKDLHLAMTRPTDFNEKFGLVRDAGHLIVLLDKSKESGQWMLGTTEYLLNPTEEGIYGKNVLSISYEGSKNDYNSAIILAAIRRMQSRYGGVHDSTDNNRR